MTKLVKLQNLKNYEEFEVKENFIKEKYGNLKNYLYTCFENDKFTKKYCYYEKNDFITGKSYTFQVVNL